MFYLENVCILALSEVAFVNFFIKRIILWRWW